MHLMLAIMRTQSSDIIMKINLKERFFLELQYNWQTLL